MKLIFGSKDRIILTVLFIASIIYWIFFLLISHYHQSPLGLYTQIPLAIIPIYGGIIGWIKSQQWGRWKSYMGRGIIFLSLGMFVWGFALGMWTYYTVVGQTTPYPSLADYVFIWSPVLWLIGLTQISKVTGARFSLTNLKETIIGILITLSVAFLSYVFIIVVAHGNRIGTTDETFGQLFFDYAYTIEIIFVAILVGAIYGFSRKYLGGKYKAPILLLFLGFFIHVIAIFFFVQTTANSTYFNGNIADILFTIAVFLESIGILNLDTLLL